MHRDRKLIFSLLSPLQHHSPLLQKTNGGFTRTPHETSPLGLGTPLSHLKTKSFHRTAIQGVLLSSYRDEKRETKGMFSLLHSYRREEGGWARGLGGRRGCVLRYHIGQVWRGLSRREHQGGPQCEKRAPSGLRWVLRIRDINIIVLNNFYK